MRALVGPEMLIGLSTHSPAQIAAAGDAAQRGEVDYIGVGPVHCTPTKPGRAATGLDVVRHAARHAQVPFFAIGGIDAGNLADVLDAGARRVAVVRAIAHAQDPRSAARRLREALDAAATGREVVHGGR